MRKEKKVLVGLAVLTGLGTLIYWLTRPAEAVPPPPGKAILMIKTTPIMGAVYINGVYQGVAPMTFEVDPGTYTISFGDIEGYYTPSGVTITLAEGETRTVTGEYEQIIPGRATLIVTSIPVRVWFWVDDRQYRTSSDAPHTATIHLDAGTHTVRWGASAGYLTPPPETVTLRAGEVVEIVVRYELDRRRGLFNPYFTDTTTGIIYDEGAFPAPVPRGHEVRGTVTGKVDIKPASIFVEWIDPYGNRLGGVTTGTTGWRLTGNAHRIIIDKIGPWWLHAILYDGTGAVYDDESWIAILAG